jgi:GDP/UDP-N,N'-diacetylbacillosamine 2-epimerase (hydrolysing)
VRICIATGSRAEYGLLKPLIDKIIDEQAFVLQLLVTASHLSPEFGLTYKQIEEDNLKINSKVEMLLSSDTPEGIAKSMGLGMIGFADSLKVLNPDLLVILGDRYEMLALASTALVLKVPIAHIHGGELTEGAYDDAIRHCITKMSHLHFTSTETYRRRVIQLGERPEYVFNVGAIGLDNVSLMEFLSRQELEDSLGIKFRKHNFIIAFHPETLSDISVEMQFQTVLDGLDIEGDSLLIFTNSNADTNGRIINYMIREFVNRNSDLAVVFPSLGSLKFLSVMRICDAIIGNSSSGIIEATSLHTYTINIGDRQKGRIQSQTIFNCAFDVQDIKNRISQVKSSRLTNPENLFINPYGKGSTSMKIIDAIKRVKIPHSKSFYDINYE